MSNTASTFYIPIPLNYTSYPYCDILNLPILGSSVATHVKSFCRVYEWFCPPLHICSLLSLLASFAILAELRIGVEM